VYDALLETLGDEAIIDLHIYNNDYAMFKKLVVNNTEDYSNYVIIPHFFDSGDCAHAVINALPKDKLLLLDKKPAGVNECFSLLVNAVQSCCEKKTGLKK
jgi:hypothetical protein